MKGAGIGPTRYLHTAQSSTKSIIDHTCLEQASPSPAVPSMLSLVLLDSASCQKPGEGIRPPQPPLRATQASFSYPASESTKQRHW